MGELRKWLKASPENARLYAQESVILSVGETVRRELSRQKMSQNELAAKLDRCKGHVSRMLSGDKNMTLRTLGDIAHALGCEVEIKLRKRIEALEAGDE